MRCNRWYLLVLLWVFVVGTPKFFAQNAVNISASATISVEEETSQKTLTTLAGILEAETAIKAKLQDLEDALKTAETEEARTRIAANMEELRSRLMALENNFQSIATGLDVETFAQKPKTAFDWREEFQEILGPILEELKNMTARPREIERLRKEVDTYQRRLDLINNALDNLLVLKQYVRTQALSDRLSALENAWIEREKEVANQLEVAQYQLAEKQDAQKPLTDSVQDLVREFFSQRGRNIVLAILAFVGVFLGLHYLYKYLIKISPFHEGRKRTFYGRLIDVIYMVVTFLGATMALILVLYVAGDWVLLALVLILLLGFIWAARQGLPMVWEQVKILLNLSTVRENERVIYNGLPWRVVALNLYTRFHNPALKGGMIRLPLRDLVGLQSRPFHKDEPWFPCQEDDWVLLADGTFGHVGMQTPEIVQLLLLGGSHKTYPTLAFLDQNPTNLSKNFRVELTFGVDYKHQGLSTQEIPEKLKARLQADLAREGYEEHLHALTVEFQEAGASSLDMAILADFAGALAPQYPKLQRLLQRIAVDACNEHAWVIPFTQITVHSAQSSSN